MFFFGIKTPKITLAVFDMVAETGFGVLLDGIDPGGFKLELIKLR